jgi:hypothetical protein
VGFSSRIGGISEDFEAARTTLYFGLYLNQSGDRHASL